MLFILFLVEFVHVWYYHLRLILFVFEVVRGYTDGEVGGLLIHSFLHLLYFILLLDHLQLLILLKAFRRACLCHGVEGEVHVFYVQLLDFRLLGDIDGISLRWAQTVLRVLIDGNFLDVVGEISGAVDLPWHAGRDLFGLLEHRYRAFTIGLTTTLLCFLLIVATDFRPHVLLDVLPSLFIGLLHKIDRLLDTRVKVRVTDRGHVNHVLLEFLQVLTAVLAGHFLSIDETFQGVNGLHVLKIGRGGSSFGAGLTRCPSALCQNGSKILIGVILSILTSIGLVHHDRWQNLVQTRT